MPNLTRKGRPASTLPVETYSSSQVSKIARVSLRQLQWWDERNVVSPRHHGHKRMYLPEEVLEITVIAELRRKGFSLQKLRRVLRYLQRDMGRRLSEVVNGDSDLHLLTDGRTIYLEERRERVIEILKGARQPMFLVCVTDHARRLGPIPKKTVRTETGAATRKSRAV